MTQQASYFDDAFDAAEDPLEDLKTVDEVEEEPVTLEEETLLTRGYFSSTVKLGNNEIVLRTLKIGEELEAALIADKYKETVEASRALITALIAASIVSVNNEPLIRYSLGKADSTLEARFNFIADNWYWTTIRVLYEEYNSLLEKSLVVNQSVKKN